MVRVNFVPVKNLADQHAMAEYNEILMLMSYIIAHPTIDDVSLCYTLGKGHMKFFKNKVGFLERRFHELKNELLCRKYKVTQEFPITSLPLDHYNEYIPTQLEIELSKQRILKKITLKPRWYKYYRKSHDFVFWEKLVGND